MAPKAQAAQSQWPDLRTHIHSLLDNYIEEHLTTDYPEFTQLRVYQILTEGLIQVSTHDSHTLVIPSDPLEVLVQNSRDDQSRCAQDRLSADKQAQELIYHAAQPMAPADLNNRFDGSHSIFDAEPPDSVDSAVLTVRSIRRTPRHGTGKAHFAAQTNFGDVLHNARIASVVLEEVFDDGIDARTEGIIRDVRLSVDECSRKAVSSLYQGNPMSSGQASRAELPPSHGFLHRPLSPLVLDPVPQTPPLFSRSHATSSAVALPPASMSELPVPASFAYCSADGASPELAVVADNWSVFDMTSSPEPSLDTSLSGQDDLFAPSSDVQGPINDLLLAGMDDIRMPRDPAIRGACGDPQLPRGNQRFQAYISPFVDAVRNMDHDAKYERRESSPDHNTSLLLSSIPGFDNTVNFLEQNGFLCDLTPEVQDMVTTDVVLGPHPTSVVIDPMEVPRLPEPNAHAGSPDLPRDLNALATNERFSAFYANKGTKSLNLELTWRPYNSEKAAPTLEELVGVSDFCGLLSAACDSLSGGRASIVDLLKEIGVLAHPLTSNEETTRLWERFFSATTTPDTGSTGRAQEHPNCVDSSILLTRTDRHRALRQDTEVPSKVSHTTCLVSLTTPNYTRGSHDLEQDDVPASVRVSTFAGPSLRVPRTLSTDDAFCVDEDWVEELLSAYVPQNFPLDAAQNDHEQNNLARHRSAEAIDPDPVIFPKQIPSHSGSPEAHGEQSLQGYLAALAIQPSSLPSCPKLVTPPMSLGEDGSSVQKYDEIDAEDLVRQLAGYAPASPLCWEQPPSNHRYLASVDLLQDRSLTRALQRDQLGVELLEREWLDGADLVFDCDSAAVLAPLLSLPSDCSSVKSRLIALSWKYTHITVIFRAYGSTVPFLPPQGQLNQVNLPALVINSVKKLLRDLGIANVYGTKRPETSVQLLFAASSERAAASARLAGDAAEERSRHGRWGSRLWLSADEQEGERSLNEAEGMNAFAAAAILSRTTLNDFLALSASQRLQLALPIQEETMVRFNDYVARRHQSVSENFSDDFGDREAHFLVDTT